MNAGDNIEELVMRFTVKPSASLDERILAEAGEALEKSLKYRPGTEKRKSKTFNIAVYAAAAVFIILGFLLLVQMFTGADKEEIKSWWRTTHATDDERNQVQQMYLAGDVEGLVDVLSKGSFEGRVLAANYLAEIGDERALGALKKVYFAAQETLPEDYSKNPFTEPLEKLRERLKNQELHKEIPASANQVATENVQQIEPNVVTAVEDSVNEPEKPVVTAKKEGVIDFLVVSEQTRKPVAGAKVHVHIQREGPDEKFDVITDGNGLCMFDVGSLDTRYISIEVSKDKFVPMQVYFQREGKLIEVPGYYRLELPKGISIGGHVENEQAEAIAGATVSIMVRTERPDEREQVRTNLHDREVQTDANGFWRFDILPQGVGKVYTKFSHPDYVDEIHYRGSGERGRPSFEKFRNMEAVLVMEKGVRVLGLVIDSKGSPIKGARVSQGQSRYGEYPRTKTNKDGKFEFGQCRKGSITLTVQAEGFGPALREVVVREGMEPVEFQLGPGHKIRGRIIDLNNNQIEGVQVTADTWRGYRSIDWDSETNSEGYFTWHNAPEDEVLFDFYKNGYMSVRKFPLSAGIDEYEIVMYPELRISGQVFVAETNKPVKEFNMIPGWTHGDRESRTYWEWHRKSEFLDGRYEQSFNYPRDGHLIRIEAQGYQPAVSRIFYDNEGEVEYDFSLDKGQGLKGRIYYWNGRPAAGVEMTVWPKGQHIYIRDGQMRETGFIQDVVTDANGQFTLSSSEDNQLVIIEDDGYAALRTQQLSQDPNIILEQWGRLEGTVKLSGEFGREQQIQLYSANSYRDKEEIRISFRYETMSDSNGNFIFEKLPAGSAYVGRVIRLSERSTTTSHRVPVEIQSGRTASVTIGGGGRPVIGRLKLPSDYNEPVDWGSARGSFYSQPPQLAKPNYPDNFHLMTFKERIKWMLDWQKTEQGQEMIRRHLMPEYPESIVDMNQAQIQAYFQQWKKSEQGKAFQRAQKELQKDRRHYNFRIEPDGSFRVEDIPGGNYNMNIRLRKRAGGPYYSGRDEIIGTLKYDFKVPDVGDGEPNEPFDIGVLELKIKKSLEVGKVFPDIEMSTFEGEKVKLSDYRSKVIVFSMWTTYWREFDKEIGDLKDVYELFRDDEDFVMIGLCLDGSIDSAKEFLKKNPLEWNNFLLSRKSRMEFYQKYSTSGQSGTFILGPQGKILAKNPALGQMVSKLDELLGED